MTRRIKNGCKLQALNSVFTVSLTAFASLFLVQTAHAEWEHIFGLESWYFLADTDNDIAGKDDNNLAFRYEPKYTYLWNNGDDMFEFEAKFRWDRMDHERKLADIQTLTWLHVSDSWGGWESRVGVRKVFWGVTESAHLVDIINQSDLSDNLDGEDKLGQPMLNLSLVRDWGILDAFVLLGFRERRFTGEKSRFAFPINLEQDRAVYASGADEETIDFALRWTHSIGDWEFGLSHFSGVSREPVTDICPLSSACPNDLRLPTAGVNAIPVYHTIDQTGLEITWIVEGLIVKLEAISRSGQGDASGLDRYAAAAGGFEYTQVGIFDSAIDLGWVVEYLYDERGDRAPGFAEHDWFAGARWSFNDVADSNALMGVIFDDHNNEYSISLEADRRFGDSWRVSLEARGFHSSKSRADFLAGDPDAKLAPYEKQDYLLIDVAYYF